jgi:triacylglycerol esterase/lipase EstA (alpha/beta hydrolase family)
MAVNVFFLQYRSRIMGKPSKQAIEYVRGLIKLAINATKGTTNLVETMHNTIEKVNKPLGDSYSSTTSGITGLAYKSIRGGSQLIGTSLDYAMQTVLPFLEENVEPSKTRDIFLSVINGVYGDKLEATENPLVLEMKFFCQQQELIPTQLKLNLKQTSEKIMLFVHGLCMSHHCWEGENTNLSSDMAQKLGYTPVYLHYNTGRTIATNGCELASKLEELVSHWPITITDIIIVGHSMGGLVARSARYYAGDKDYNWLHVNKKLASIATPHNGAALEKGVSVLENLVQLSPYALPFTRLSKIRSRGIENLRQGSITEIEDEFVELPRGVEYFALAAVLSHNDHPAAKQIIGDGLVTLDSALGQSKNPTRVLSIPSENKWTGYGIGHNEMLCHLEVFEQLTTWLQR